MAEVGGLGGGGGEGARGCGHALAMPPGVGSGEAGARWGVSGGGGEGAGGCGHALAALRKCNQVWVVAKPGWGGVWAVGVVRARGGVGTHWQPLNTLNTKEMRARCGYSGEVWEYSLNTCG